MKFAVLNEDGAQLWIGDAETGELIEMIPDDADPREYLAAFIARRAASRPN